MSAACCLGISLRCVAGVPDQQTAAAESGFEWPRYPRILVALDETRAAAFALRHAVPYAVDQGSQLTLLTVVPDPPRMVVAAGVSPQRMTEEMESRAEQHLRQVVATLPRELSVTTILRRGDPGRGDPCAGSRGASRPHLHGRPWPRARQRRPIGICVERCAAPQPSASRRAAPAARAGRGRLDASLFGCYDVIRIGTSYFVTDVRWPGVSSAGIALSTSSPRL